MHSPYWKHLREIADGLRIYQPWIEGGSLPLRLSTQLFNSPCIHMYSIYSCSSYLSWMSLQTQLLGYLLLHAPAAFPGCLSSFKVTLELAAKLYENLTYGLHAPHGCIKLQRKKHTEQRITDNNYNNNNNIIWKISIQLTSVGLAHARPIMLLGFLFSL